MRRFAQLIVLLALVAVAWQPAFAQTFSVQGVLRNSSGRVVSDGSYSLTFRLYEQETGGTPVWQETQGALQVKHGVYVANLGEISSLGSLSFARTYWLSIAVGGGNELAPRIKLTNAPYAMSATGADKVFPSAGNVGIGTKTPGTALHVAGSGDVKITVDSDAGSAGGLALAENDSRKWEITHDPADHSLDIAEVGVGEAVTIQPGGNVGIGTTSPQSRLHVSGNVKADGQIRTTGDTTGLEIGDDAFIGGIDSTRIGIRTGGDWRLTVTKDGKVGIGTTNPAQTLHINGNLKLTGKDSKIQFSDGSALSSSARLGEGAAGSLSGYGDIFITADSDADSAGAIKLAVGDSTHVVVTPDGRVGVGTGQPAYALDVNGDIGVSGDILKNGAVFQSGGWKAAALDTMIERGSFFESFEDERIRVQNPLESRLYPGWNGTTSWTSGTGIELTTYSFYHGTQSLSLRNSKAWTTLTVNSDCSLFFYAYIYSGILTFYRDGAAYSSWGTTDGEWREFSVPLTAGTHTIKWFTGEGGVYQGSANIDFIYTNDYQYTGPSAQYTDGNVGIGTSSPQYALDINGSLNANQILADGKPINNKPETAWKTSSGGARVSRDRVTSVGGVNFGKNWNDQMGVNNSGVIASNARINGILFDWSYLYPERGTSGYSTTFFGFPAKRWEQIWARNVRYYAWDYTSDRRVKKNITPLSNSLDSILRLNGVRYNINSDTHPFYAGSSNRDETGDNLGFVGQELEGVIPEMVQEDEKSGLLMVSDQQLYPVLTEAMKEFKTGRIDPLKTEVGELEKELERQLEERRR